MNDPGTFRIGSIPFYGSFAPDGSGFTVRTVDGWIDAPAIRQDTAPRPVADGDFDALAFLGSREITLTGLCMYESPAEGGDMQRRLSGMQQMGPVDFQGDYLGLQLWGRGRVVDWRFAEVVPGAIADYSITVRSAKSFLFGELREFTGSTAQVSHRGNARALPVIEVTGTLSAGYEVRSQGKTYEVTQALTSGQTHRIDMATGWLYRNGTLQVGAVAVTETFAIPPYVVTPVVFDPVSGSGVMTVKLHDTFV